MFLERLTIYNGAKIIREIPFHQGINLIVDETPVTEVQRTGNNVGKTTVLKLIDFCLGADAATVYSDTENKKESYALVKDFLTSNPITIELVLTNTLDEDAIEKNQVIIERNFLARKKAIRSINGVPYTEKQFEQKLEEFLLYKETHDKPSFRQIISHNIRYKDENINNTIKTLDKYTKDVEYEALYLYLLGCCFDEATKKQIVLSKIKQENLFKERLEKKQTKNAYEITLAILNEEINKLQEKKLTFNINENFTQDLENLNSIKFQINHQSFLLSGLNTRREIILETKNEMIGNVSNIDLKQLHRIYRQALEYVDGIQKSFEDLVNYHNNMLQEKIKFLTADLPELEKEITDINDLIEKLLKEEKDLSLKVSKSDSFEELEKIIAELNQKYQLKGEYEGVISQFDEIEKNLEIYNADLAEIDGFLFSNDYEECLKNQIIKFNRHFSAISNELYGERYALKYEKFTNRNKQTLYKFNSFNANLSSGKKQGEILCFDLAYTMFADEEKIPCMHFLLNDKKELMHGNQLIKISEFLIGKNVQLVFSILKDKLPEALNQDEYIVLKLSQDNKLFKIEQQLS